MPFIFKNPEFFWLFALLPVLFYRYWRVGAAQGEVRFSTLQGFRAIKPNARVYLRHVPFVLRVCAFCLLVVAIARPQSSAKGQNVETEGIDIVLAMDISGSMLAEDFKPNRIEAAKKLAVEFIESRPNDRIGLVVFSGESFTQCPLTTDHDVLKNLFGAIKSGMVLDGTAIGLGLSTAVSRLKDSEAKSKVVILLTDGVNNSGSVAPLTSAEIARTFGIRVYTIGIGTYGFAPYPVQTPFGIQYQNLEVQIDEDVMKQIAHMTNGRYFRATSNTKLQEVYNEIDKLERTKIFVTEFRRYSEEFYPFALAAAALLLLEILLRYTVLRSIP
ncbi:MAG: VWA domain-containing protein [Candidatus Kapaibacterium sp.]|nr:MAG: VWA domain-containing protein [Candidatus Kapabacteria bacterium]